LSCFVYEAELDTPIGNGGAYRHYKYNFEKIPIPQIYTTEQKPFEVLVDKILALHLSGGSQPPDRLAIQELENEIDALVFGLYGLSEDEMLQI
jgi:adenine-specific DNA-methyltransferase